jgi:hypothetical protein
LSDQSSLANDEHETQKNYTENIESPAQEFYKAPSHGWKHYFFEFLILFPAVFQGFFLAENVREYPIEQQRSEQYMRSFRGYPEVDRKLLIVQTPFPERK